MTLSPEKKKSGGATVLHPCVDVGHYLFAGMKSNFESDNIYYVNFYGDADLALKCEEAVLRVSVKPTSGAAASVLRIKAFLTVLSMP